MPLYYFQDNSPVTYQNFVLLFEINDVSNNIRDNIMLLMHACYSNEGYSQFIRKCVKYQVRTPYILCRFSSPQRGSLHYFLFLLLPVSIVFTTPKLCQYISGRLVKSDSIPILVFSFVITQVHFTFLLLGLLLL